MTVSIKADFRALFQDELGLIEEKLDKVLPTHGQKFTSVHEAMRYSVLGGGKRFRPLLVLLACRAAGGTLRQAIIPAAAVELVHSYSLIHDDLPCMDNDDFRRGKLTCHKKFGEALALLAGDGLLTLAFQVLGEEKSSAKGMAYVRELSTAAGTYGMIGGQVADMAMTPDTDLPTLEFIHTHKTGKLIRASAVCGAIAAGASPELRRRLLRFGEWLGLAFQMADDYLDGDGFAREVSREDLAGKIRDLIARSKRELKPLGKRARRLDGLGDFLVEQIRS